MVHRAQAVRRPIIVTNCIEVNLAETAGVRQGDDKLFEGAMSVRTSMRRGWRGWLGALVAGALVAGVLAACGGGGGGSEGSGGATPASAAPSALSYPAIPALTVGVPMSSVLPTVSGSVSGFSVSPSLPAGLSLNEMSGTISGTPTTATPAATYTVQASNTAGATTAALSIAVNAASPLRLEPVSGTTIGVGQQLDVFAAFRAQPSDPFPQYLDPALVALTSSQSGVASVDSSGVVRGLANGTTTITASYQGFTAQVPITVAGSYVERQLLVPGQGVRRYAVYLPAGTGVRPLIMAMHGGGGTARIQASTTLLARLGAQQGVLIAFIEGSGAIQTFNAGNCCGSAQTQNVDDIAFVAAVLADVVATYSVDASRVYATGFSNGGMMSHRIACALADRFTGIAAVGGASGQRDAVGNTYYACNPARPIRILHLHATNDRNYPYAGGVGDGLSNTNFYSIDATIADWRVRNNVTGQATIEAATSSTTCFRYETPANASLPSAPVALCKTDPVDVFDPATGIVHGGGHSWPGGNRSPSPTSDSPVTDFDANTHLWGFLNR